MTFKHVNIHYSLIHRKHVIVLLNLKQLSPVSF